MLRADVEMLNNSITGLGQSFANRRREQEDVGYRQQLLDREIERQKTAQSHYDAESQHYKNIEDKQDAILKSQQAQQAIKLMNEQYDKLQQGASNDDEFNKAAQLFVQTHKDATDTILKNSAFAPWADNPNYKAKVVQKGQFNTAPIANDTRAAALNAQADALDQQASEQQGSISVDAYGALKRQAASLRNRAQSIVGYGQRQGAQDYAEQVQRDAQGNELGRTRTYGKQPAGAAAAAHGGKPITDKKGNKWLYFGNMPDPSKDKDPSNWQAQN